MPPESEGGDWIRSRWLAPLLLTGIAVVWVSLAGNPCERQERAWFDQTLRWRTQLGWTSEADPRIVVLGIDDVDMAALPDLGAEYRAVAAAISQASDLGVAVIAVDAIYLRGTPEMAKPMLAAVENGSPAVFAEAVRGAPGEATGTQRLRSFPFLAERVHPNGLVNVNADRDGIFRTYSLRHRTEQATESSLAFATYELLNAHEGRTGKTGSEESAADNLLNFRGSWASGAGFFHLTLRDLSALHAAKSPQGLQPLAGKVIFVSNTATGIAEVGASPFSANQPLVLLHATALNDLLQGSAIHRAPRWGDALAFLIVPMLSVATVLPPRKRGLLLLWLIGSTAILGIGLLFLFKFGWLLASVGTVALWTGAMVLELARRHTIELAERRYVRSTLGQYFAPGVLNAVLDNPGRLEPKKVEITALMVDLRNSTPLTELLGADEMFDLLNKVFEVQIRAAFNENGSIDAPVGDRFLAYWGAPDPQPDASERALRAAHALIEGMEALRKTLKPEIRALFGFGVAIHRGAAVIGDVGSDQYYYHYGPVGDILNATARIESLTKQYGVVFLITSEVLSELSTKPEQRLLDRVIVKGKTTPLELIDVRNQFNSANFAEIAARYGVAFECYQRGDFAGAGQRFRDLADIDKPSRLMADRCANLLFKLPVDWQGVFAMEEK